MSGRHFVGSTFCLSTKGTAIHGLPFKFFNLHIFFSEPNNEIVLAALQAAPPPPPGGHGGNGGPQNKPVFRGNNGSSGPGGQQFPPPGLQPTMGGGARLPANGEQRAPPPIGQQHIVHGVPGSQLQPGANLIKLFFLRH